MSVREVFGYRWDTAYPFEPVRGAYVGRTRRGHRPAVEVPPDLEPEEPEPMRDLTPAPMAQLGLSL